MDILMGLRRTIKNFPDSPAVIDGEVRLNWREFGERHRRLVSGLSQLGLRKGDRIATLMLNSFRYLELYYGVPSLGAMIVPLNIRLSPTEIAYVLNDSGAEALIVDDMFAPMVEKIKPNLKTVQHVIFAGKGAAPEGMIA